MYRYLVQHKIFNDKMKNSTIYIPTKIDRQSGGKLVCIIHILKLESFVCMFLTLSINVI